jgi:hypothetical protein
MLLTPLAERPRLARELLEDSGARERLDWFDVEVLRDDAKRTLRELS